MPNNIFGRLEQLAHIAVHRISVKSALNPMLWLCAIATPMCFFAAYEFQSNKTLSLVLIIAGLVPIGVACLGFAGLAIFKPEKLQSEDYQIRHETLQLIQQKVGRLTIESASLEAIANPAQKLLEEEGGEVC